ncbi:MAG: alkaline phosphatase family protein [Planctomycetes bacterium]|nr:alkaline phosphatase family protein [Planctomycetota bacterium]
MGISRRTFLKTAGVAAGAAAVSYGAWQALRAPGPHVGDKLMTRYDKVILLGIDGLDPRIVTRLRAEGAAPNFDRLWRQGCGGALRTVTPSQSPVVWSSMATGTNPGKHGVFDFIHRDPKRPLPYLSVCQRGSGLLKSSKYVQPRKNAAFWNILTDANVPVSVIRWPVTFPAEQINGRMFSGLGVPGIRGTLGRYSFYTNAPASAPDVPPESLTEVDLIDGRAQTIAQGPSVRGMTGTKEATIPMTLKLVGGRAEVSVSGNSLTLAPGEWSDWVRLEFSVGPLKKITSIVKFYLLQSRPEFKLYMTSLEPDPLDPAVPMASPTEYAADLARKIGLYHTLGMPEDTKALNDNAITPEMFAQQCGEITEERFSMFWHEFEKFEDGVLAFVFDTSDRIQHMFWRDNKMDENLSVVQLTPYIRDHYILMDAFLGRLLDRMGPDTALIVVSDHGFTSFNTCFDLNAWLVEEGFMTLTRTPAGLNDDEVALYRLVDWSNTMAYGCGFTSLYLNLKGREGNGIVAPSEADRLTRKIADRIRQYKDARTGNSPVDLLARREDIYSGPEFENAPDMVLGTAPGYRMSWQTPIGGVAENVLSRNERHWAGDHIVDPATVPGTIMSNIAFEVDNARVIDVAPTTLALLGLQAGEDCDGQPLSVRKSL